MAAPAFTEPIVCSDYATNESMCNIPMSTYNNINACKTNNKQIICKFNRFMLGGWQINQSICHRQMWSHINKLQVLGMPLILKIDSHWELRCNLINNECHQEEVSFNYWPCWICITCRNFTLWLHQIRPTRQRVGGGSVRLIAHTFNFVAHARFIDVMLFMEGFTHPKGTQQS